MYRASLLVLAISLFHDTNGQKDTYPVLGPHLGVGMGQDVGGIVGARLTYWGIPYVGCFIGGGWAVAGASYNAGAEVRLPTQGRASPFIVAMYGYNGVIHVKGKEELDKIYFGPTLGVGVMLRQRITRNYWRFSVNLPLRSQQMLDDWEAIKARPEIEVRQDLLPITIGVGFHLCLSKPVQTAR